MSNLPTEYRWLKNEPAPAILREALQYYGLREGEGPQNNPIILGWAKELGAAVSSWYDSDDKAWCGLFMAICCKRAGLPYPGGFQALRAKGFLNWGTEQKIAALGDVLVFGRTGGGHVGLYVGEDRECYHVLGGNQKDQVRVMRIAKGRLLPGGIRRTLWKVMQPPNVRVVKLAPNGEISHNEA